MNKQQLLAAAATAALSAGMGAAGITPLWAADVPTAQATQQQSGGGRDVSGTKTTSPDVPDEALIKVSEDARMTMRNLSGARLAIFNGLPNEAQTYIDAAVTRVGATANEASQYELDKQEPIAGDIYVPYDVSFSIAEVFEPTPDKMKKVNEAKEHLKKGEKQEARDALKAADTEIAVTAQLLPVNFAKGHIAEASKLIGEGKYYEANLALKSVEDAVVVETFAIDAIPDVKGKG